MKKAAMIIPALALLLLGAHGLRQGDLGLAAAFALLAGLFPGRRAWVRPVAVAALLWGGWLWAGGTVDFLRFRQAFGFPWIRLAVIMGAILLFNALALWVLVSRAGREFFHERTEQAMPRAAVMILVCAGLAVARAKVPFPILLADRYLPGWGWLEIFLLGFYGQWPIRPHGFPKGTQNGQAPHLGTLFRNLFPATCPRPAWHGAHAHDRLSASAGARPDRGRAFVSRWRPVHGHPVFRDHPARGTGLVQPPVLHRRMGRRHEPVGWATSAGRRFAATLPGRAGCDPGPLRGRCPGAAGHGRFRDQRCHPGRNFWPDWRRRHGFLSRASAG